MNVDRIPKTHGILLSGGSGSRMKSDIPKQFLTLQGKPVLYWSVKSLLQIGSLDSLHLVVHPEFTEESRAILKEAVGDRILPGGFHTITGGSSRHGSTLMGLESVSSIASESNDTILIHDAARPVLTDDELSGLIQSIREGNPVASLAARITDTIVQADNFPGKIQKRLDRNVLFSIKTPQAASYETLVELAKLPEEESFTDLLTWAEKGGVSGFLVEASPFNHKITIPSDLPLFEFYLSVTGMKSTEEGGSV